MKRDRCFQLIEECSSSFQGPLKRTDTPPGTIHVGPPSLQDGCRSPGLTVASVCTLALSLSLQSLLYCTAFFQKFTTSGFPTAAFSAAGEAALSKFSNFRVNLCDLCELPRLVGRVTSIRNCSAMLYIILHRNHAPFSDCRLG